VDEAELAEHVVGLTCSLASCQFRYLMPVFLVLNWCPANLGRRTVLYAILLHVKLVMQNSLKDKILYVY